MRKALALAVILVAGFATSLFAVGEARITGVVLDGTTKAPLPGVKITVTATEKKNITQNYTSDKDGKFAIMLIDGTIIYKFSFVKDGYVGHEENIKLKLLPEKNERTITLVDTRAASAAAGAAQVAVADPAVLIYNEAVELANSGSVAEAIAKVEEAISLKPDLGVAWITLTRLQARQSNWAKAIEAGNKALSFDPSDESVLAILADAYDKTGDKVKAAEFRKKAPANAGYLFNEAARLINGGKDDEAEPLLRQAIGADEKFSQAYYELGMIYVRSGRNADAKSNLQKYLELDPNGRDAAIAKEMLTYVK
jgi:tetratricopeptide (TPR) repeat protein